MSAGDYYEAGEAELTPCDKRGWEYFDYGDGVDCGEEHEPHHYEVILPHQCDAWHIGGLVEVEQLIADLQALVPKLKALGEKGVVQR